MFYDTVKGFENEPEKGLRCNKCFELRLNKTAQKAKELGFKQFTTTLSVSPHKVSKIFLKKANLMKIQLSKIFLTTAQDGKNYNTKH